MAIQVQDLLDQKAKRFGASPTASDFQQLFLDCLNYVLDDIEHEIDGETADRVDAIEDEIDLDQQQYQAVLSLGLDYYISREGEWTNAPAEKLQLDYFRKLRARKREYQRGLTLGGKFGAIT